MPRPARAANEAMFPRVSALADVAIQNRPPRNEGELPAVLNQGVAAGSKLDGATINAVNPLARPGLGIGEAELVGELTGDPVQFPTA